MLNLCMIQPPIEDFYSTPIRNIPLGLLSIGACLVNHRVQILDLRRGKPRKITLPEALSDVHSFYRPDDASPFSLYKNYYRFGAIESEIQELLPDDTDVFLISSLFTAYFSSVRKIIKIIKGKYPEKIVIIGGSCATIQPKLILDNGADYVIIGEGETVVKELLDRIDSGSADITGISNLVWKSKGKFFRNPRKIIEDLDALPFPDYSIPGVPDYQVKKKKHAMLLASRGCPNKCSFCSIHHTMGNNFRSRSVENVLAEMEAKIAQGFRSSDFEDDHFGGNKNWFVRLLDGIIEKFPSYNLSLFAMNGITASNLSENILGKMKKSGFDSLNLALVTPDKSSQQILNRPFGTEKFTGTVKLAKKLNMFITAYLIIGLPHETPEDVLKHLIFVGGLPCLIGPSLLYIVPETYIFDEMRKNTDIPQSPLCYRSSYFPYSRKEFDRTSAMTLFRIARMINFMKQIVDRDDFSQNFKIEKDRIILERGLSGKQSQYSLGIALLIKFFESGKIYGTDRKVDNYYSIVEEKCDNKIVAAFKDSIWKISSIHKDSCLDKKSFLEKLVSN